MIQVGTDSLVGQLGDSQEVAGEDSQVEEGIQQLVGILQQVAGEGILGKHLAIEEDNQDKLQATADLLE